MFNCEMYCRMAIDRQDPVGARHQKFNAIAPSICYCRAPAKLRELGIDPNPM
ncbi:MAG: hypothetical protein AB4352_14105 [Hormoscilla sp.]